MTALHDRSAIGTLAETLRQRREQKGAELLAGLAADFADYKARTAYIQALNDVLGEMDTIVKDMTGR
jgi:hypothetical protein